MADSADIENALTARLGTAFYPNTTSQPCIISSEVMIIRGWPTQQQFRAAVTAGATIISVHADKGMAADRTRYQRNYTGTPGTPTITAAISGLAVTFAGTVAVGHAIAAQCQGVWFPYLVLSTDTLTTIAAAFVVLIPGASSSGAVLTLPSGRLPPQVRIVMVGSFSVEVSRQVAMFRISCWAPTPALRDAAFGQLPGLLAYLGSRLTLPDGSIATWMGQSESGPDDVPARANEWRRDILAKYDWPVLYSQAAMPLLLLEINIEANGQTFNEAGDVTYPTDIITDAEGNPYLDLDGNLIGIVSPQS